MKALILKIYLFLCVVFCIKTQDISVIMKPDEYARMQEIILDIFQNQKNHTSFSIYELDNGKAYRIRIKTKSYSVQQEKGVELAHYYIHSINGHEYVTSYNPAVYDFLQELYSQRAHPQLSE